MKGWTLVSESLPEPYQDVFVLRSDKTYTVGRINRDGCWEKASYHKCKYQYGIYSLDVVAWQAPDLSGVVEK